MAVLSSKFLTSSSNAITGRFRLHGVISSGTQAGEGSITSTTVADRTIIELKHGSDDSGETGFKFVNTMNGYGNSVHGQSVMIDVPGEGILFPDGVYVKLHNNCVGICLIVSGTS
tara:strand:+ start:1683 stop:2027 length:345 start_codon:yes stop_codon:yes gene_type:complete